MSLFSWLRSLVSSKNAKRYGKRRSKLERNALYMEIFGNSMESKGVSNDFKGDVELLEERWMPTAYVLDYGVATNTTLAVSWNTDANWNPNTGFPNSSLTDNG